MSATNGNGKHALPAAPPPQMTLEEIKEATRRTRVANRYTRAMLEAQQLQVEAHLSEAWPAAIDGGDVFGGTDSFYNRIRQQYGEGWVPPSVPSDRKGGAKWPVWRTEQELGRLRQASRLLCSTNDYAKALVRNLTNYVIGKGFTYKATLNKRRAKRRGVDKETGEQLVEAVQTVVDEFLERNRWNNAMASLDGETDVDAGAASSRERECYRRILRDGEAFMRFFFYEDGTTDVRFVDPELVSSSGQNLTLQQGVSFGVKWKTDPIPDLETRLAFYVKYHDTSLDNDEVRAHTNGEWVPASEMVQMMSELEDAEVMRGTPAFSFSTIRALLRAEKLQENMSISSAVRAATAEVWKHHYGTQQQIANMSTGLAGGTAAGTPNAAYNLYGSASLVGMPAGRVRRVPEGQDVVPWPTSIGVPEYTQAKQGDLQQASSGFAAPEYLTGADSGASYAQTAETGTPFVRNGESEQNHMKGCFWKCIHRALRHAMKCGKLPREALMVVELTIEAGQIHKNNEGEMAQVENIGLQNKTISPQEVIMKRNGDPETTIQNWKEWDEAMPQQGGAGGPGGMQLPPGGGPPGPGQKQQPGEEDESANPFEQGPGAGPEQGEDLGDNQQRLDAMADIIGGAYGDKAAGMLDKKNTQESLESDLYELATPIGAGTKAKLPAAGVKSPQGVKDLSKSGPKTPKGGSTGKNTPKTVPQNFTGVINDSIGRKQYYVRGEHVKGPSEEQKAQIEKAGQGQHGGEFKEGESLNKQGQTKATALHQAHEHIKAAMRGEKSNEQMHALVDHLSKLSINDLNTLKQNYGLKADAKAKQELIGKLAARLKMPTHVAKAAGPGAKAQGWAKGIVTAPAAPKAPEPEPEKQAEPKPTEEKAKEAPDEPAGAEQQPEAEGTKQPEEGQPGPTGERAGGEPAAEPSEAGGEPVAGEAKRPGDQIADQAGKDDSQPAGEATASRVPASQHEVNRRLDRFEKFFRGKGQHEVADWMGMLRNHVNSVGTDAALKALGEEMVGGDKSESQYHDWRNMGEFAEHYLNRNGIHLVRAGFISGDDYFSNAGEEGLDPSMKVNSALPKERGEFTERKKGSFFPKKSSLSGNKLKEAQSLPGLERSEDINKVVGHEVTHITPDVAAKLDETYGAGKWVVKAYGADAGAGYGIFFPQRSAQIRQDAQNAIWDAGSNLSNYGFQLRRDDKGKVVGIEHSGGDQYDFGTEKYDSTIGGDVRHWADRAAAAAPNEQGAELPNGGKEFMVQPAFAAVGVSDADRAAGKTIAPGEGRVHIVTRNGKAEIVPHSTWIKNEPLPVVFESDDTKAMAQAAVDAINALPESERKGQIYAPDVIKSDNGYKVVEANPADAVGASGYLGDNPLVIDSYVSHLNKREPAHVQFIRSLLTGEKRGKDTTGKNIRGGKAGSTGRAGLVGIDDARAAAAGNREKSAEGHSPKAFSQALVGAGELPEPEENEAGEPIEHSQEMRNQHNRRILTAARKNGVFVHPNDLPDAIKTSPNVGGMEHDVHQDATNDRFFKLTKGGRFGQNKDVHEYLRRHEIANKLWPELEHKFHGVTQDTQGNPQTIMSMARIAGSHPEQHEVHDFFKKNGWVPDEAGKWVGDDENDVDYRMWRDPKSGTVINDAHAKNFIKTDKGLVPIDVDIRPGRKMPSKLKQP